MREHTQNPLPPLEVLDFEIHAVYGVCFDLPEDRQDWNKWFEKKKNESLPIREGWTPIYRDHCGSIIVEINTPEWCKSMTVKHPKFFSQGKRGDDSTPTITMNISRDLTIRKDGVAAITIRLRAAQRAEGYDLADILAPLLLPPRIINGKNLEYEKTHQFVELEDQMATTPSPVYEITPNADPESPCALLDKFAMDNESKKSPMFKLFLGGIKEAMLEIPFLSWKEYCTTDTRELNTKKAEGENLQSSKVLPWVKDQQIPYFVVFATVPNKIYDHAFLETGAEYSKKTLANRQKYTRHIAAILFRWLTPHNVNYISLEFLESLGLLKDGAFVNKYMNSLSFVTYSSTGALCLKPKYTNSHSFEELGPQQATYGSILHCVELSRLRWHHALRLSRQLDNLTRRVILQKGTERFDDFVAELLGIRADAAQHFLDPLSYQWDATVGADIASFLQADIIEQVEDECIKKLNMVKMLMHEKLDVSRVRDMRDALDAPMRGKRS